MPRPFRDRETVTMLARQGRHLTSALEQILPRQLWGRGELESYQVQTLQGILRHAYDNIPFYRAKYDAADFVPSDFKELADLRLIPFVTKDDLRQADTVALVAPHQTRRARWLSSSGSTGQPVRICRDEESLWHFSARNMMLYHEWCEGNPLSNVLYFLDLVPDTMDQIVADLLRATVAEERIVSIAEPVGRLAERLFEVGPEFISSYPSTMRAIAATLDRQGRTFDGLRLLHLTSEMLDGQTRTLLKRVFPGARVVETYTSTEGGLMAWPCPAGDRLHLAEDAGLYEIVGTDGRAAAEMGELVLTDLTNLTMPLIRYRGLGDYCCWADGKCSCGSVHRSLRHVEGRRAESVVTTKGAMISPFLMTNAMDDVPGIVQYQIIQQSAGDFEIVVVREATAKASDDEIHNAVVKSVLNVLREHAECKVRFVDQIKAKAGAHKVPLVISHVGKGT